MANTKDKKLSDVILDITKENKGLLFTQVVSKVVALDQYKDKSQIEMELLASNAVSDLYRKNKLYLANDTLYPFNEKDFSDSKFTVVHNHRDSLRYFSITDATVLANDYEVQDKTINNSDIWTVKDKQGHDLLNLYIREKERFYGNSFERDVSNEMVRNFIKEHEKDFEEFANRPTVWKKHELQEAFIEQFDLHKKLTAFLEPVKPEQKINLLSSMSAEDLQKSRFEKIFTYTEDLAKGSIKFNEYDEKQLKEAVKERGKMVASSSAQEASMFINQYMVEALENGKNIGQALTDMRKDGLLNDWFPNDSDGLHAGIANDVLQYSANKYRPLDEKTFNPLYPQNAIPLSPSASKLVTFALPTKEGALIQKDISFLVGKEAYLLYEVKDFNVVQAVTYKDFKKALETYEAQIMYNTTEGYVDKKYWFGKEERDKFLKTHESELSSKPFGNRYFDCVFMKEKANTNEFTFLSNKIKHNLYDDLTKSQQKLVTTIENWGKENNLDLRFNRQGNNSRKAVDELVRNAKEHGFNLKVKEKTVKVVKPKTVKRVNKKVNNKVSKENEMEQGM